MTCRTPQCRRSTDRPGSTARFAYCVQCADRLIKGSTANCKGPM